MFTSKLGGYINLHKEEDKLEGWNTVEIIAKGSKYAKHIVNGVTVFELTDMTRPESMENKEVQIPLGSGKVALQLEGAELWYRNIEIKELPKE